MRALLPRHLATSDSEPELACAPLPGIECPPQLPADDLPGSVTTRLDGEYLEMGTHDGYPRFGCLDRGQPSGGLQLYHSSRDVCPTASAVASLSRFAVAAGAADDGRDAVRRRLRRSG